MYKKLKRTLLTTILAASMVSSPLSLATYAAESTEATGSANTSAISVVPLQESEEKQTVEDSTSSDPLMAASTNRGKQVALGSEGFFTWLAGKADSLVSRGKLSAKEATALKQDAKDASNIVKGKFDQVEGLEIDIDGLKSNSFDTSSDKKMIDDYYAFTSLGGVNDATHLTNLRKSMQYIKECNEIRSHAVTSGMTGNTGFTSNAKSPVRVSSKMMAIAELNANWSNCFYTHSRAFFVAENHAWNFADPYDGWYTGELKSTENGHLQNIYRYDDCLSGFAIAGPTDIQCFLDNSWTVDDYYCYDLGVVYGISVELYSQLLEEYLTSIGCKSADTNGWLLENGKWYLYDTGIIQTDCVVEDNEKKYVLNEDGEMIIGWHKINDKWLHMNASGAMDFGWIKNGGKWYYLDENTGFMTTGWQNIKGSWYFMDSDGAMKTGWLHYFDNWYYLNQSGVMATGWQKIGNNWYYMDANGIMKTGWINYGKEWYYMDKGGSMTMGWKNLGSKWYYFNRSGVMTTGWQKIGNSWYYMDANGVMKTGWIYYGKAWYYMDKSGTMMTGKATLDGKTYEFAANGVCKNP